VRTHRKKSRILETAESFVDPETQLLKCDVCDTTFHREYAFLVHKVITFLNINGSYYDMYMSLGCTQGRSAKIALSTLFRDVRLIQTTAGAYSGSTC
jgi:hypothetical protein